MDASKFLSRVIGLYLLIISSAMLMNMPQFMYKIDLLARNAPMLFAIGFFTLIIGILLVVSHNIWERNWRVIVTLVGWVVLIKGVTLIVCPQFIAAASLGFVASKVTAYSGAITDLIIGIFLCYIGFRKERRASAARSKK